MTPDAVSQLHGIPTLDGVASIYDLDTAEHSLRVAHTSASVAGLLNLPERDVLTVWWAAMFHDVGKLAMPIEVLHKMGPLDEAEVQQLRAHPAIGGDMLLAASPALAPMAAAVRAHHERWDGAGFPDRLKGERIPIGGRIIAVASAFDSMTRPRPNRPGVLGVAEAIAELRRWSGRKFDPRIVPLIVKLYHHGRVAEANAVLLGVQQLPDAVRFPQLGALSARQWEVLSHLMHGQRVQTIADELFISRTTVRNHLSAIFELFGVHSQAELVAILSGDHEAIRP